MNETNTLNKKNEQYYQKFTNTVENALSTVSKPQNSDLYKGKTADLKNKRIRITSKNPLFVKQNTKSPAACATSRNISAFIAACIFSSFAEDILIHFALLDNLPQIVICVAFAYHALSQHKNKFRMERFNRYKTEIGNKRFVPLMDFATAVNADVDFVIKDLYQFIKDGFFPQARIIEDQNMFLLDNETYQIYKQYMLENQNKKLFTEMSEQLSRITLFSEEVTMLESQIENVEFKKEVSILLNILKAVEEKLRIENKDLDELDKLINYYTPTVIKLIEQYVSFEQNTVNLQNVETGKEEIKKAVSTVNKALTQLLSELFKDDVMDIKSDIDVMQTLLKQDGLLDNDNFKKG